MSTTRQLTKAQTSLEQAAPDTRSSPSVDLTAFDDPIERAEFLEGVLCQSLDMDPDDAKLICGLVLDQFGDKDEVLDDEVPKEVRSVFYTLEKKRILTFRRIEYEGEDGMTLRGFFWRFHPDWRPPQNDDAHDGTETVYEELPETCWDREPAS